jgi:hypothetical protein
LSKAQVAQVLRGATTPSAMGGVVTMISASRLPAPRRKQPCCCETANGASPHGGTPTTHIFKLPLGLVASMKLDMRDSVENEWLCPLYDVLSAYPVLAAGPAHISPFNAKMAMAVRSKNAHWKMRDILRRHWVALGTRHGILDEDNRKVEHLIDGLVARPPELIAKVSALPPKDFPTQLANAVFDGMQDAAKRLRDQIP